MPFKAVLAMLTGFGSDKTVFDTAVAAARPAAAHIDCMHIRNDTKALAEFIVATDRMSDLLLDLEQQIIAQESDRSRRAKQVFEAGCGRHTIPFIERPEQEIGISAHWREIDEEDELIEQARCHDLTVLGRDQELSNELTQELLIRSGRPVLIAPPFPEVLLDRKIAIAWKNTPEAARAVSASLPFLQHAVDVVIFVVSEDNAAGAASAETLVTYLAWHGVKSRLMIQGTRASSEADTLRELCESAHVNLLVMGAYGHSRAREFILGKVTRGLLNECAIPVFMQH